MFNINEPLYSVYTLVEPQTHLVRYVGITSQHPSSRFSQHLCDKSNPYKYNWIQKLNRNGTLPKLEIVYQNLPESLALQEEARLIRLHRMIAGKKLTNLNDGGNLPPDWTGKKHKLSSIKKMSKQVLQMDIKTGMILYCHRSLNEASNKSGIPRTNIRRACEKNGISSGFKWMYLSKLQRC